MAPTDSNNWLSKRYWGHCDPYYDNCDSRWDSWGRWVLLAVIVVVFIAVLASLSINARRRRRRGAQPFYGTGWMAHPPKYTPNQQYPMNNYGPQQSGNEQYGYYNPPPSYPQAQQPGAAPYGSAYPTDAGYYGGQPHAGGPNQDAGLQSPPNAYQRDGPYEPPAGPPPGKH